MHYLSVLANNQAVLDNKISKTQNENKILYEELLRNRAILSDIELLLRQDIGRNILLRPILGRRVEEEEPVSRASNSTDLPSGVDYGSSVGTVYPSTVTASSSICDTLTDIPSIEEESDRRSQTRGRSKTM